MKKIVIEMLRRLEPIYGKGETLAMIHEIFRVLKGWDTTEYTIRLADDYQLSDYMQQKIADILSRLEKHEPLQYILGTADFYGFTVHVEPGVLIPRPETEELVRQIVNENKASDLKVADLGTGSGAIALALSRYLNFPEIDAIDISPKAVEVAEGNKKALKCNNITVRQGDMTHWNPDPESYDIIVSNPPYVDDSERDSMAENVKDYEPSLALFVPDADPLKFYRAIVPEAKEALKQGGKLYFEINPHHADEMQALMKNAGFRNVNVWRDSQGLNRFIEGRKPMQDDWQ